jgi:hypothetical protein
MSIIGPELVEKRIVTPHARHAAEMLLYFLDTSMEPDSRLQDMRVLQLR